MKRALAAAAMVLLAPTLARADARALLDSAQESVRQSFVADEAGLTHRASGFRCPAKIDTAVDTGEGADLSGVAEGTVADAAGQDAAHCIYAAQGRTVAYLAFSRAIEPISAEWCNALPKTLGLDMGPGVLALSGQRKFETPHRLAEMTIAGLPTFACSWSRPPVDSPIVITMVMAAQNRGWTATAIHTPAPPPGLNGYRGRALPAGFLLLSLRLLDMAVSPRA